MHHLSGCRIPWYKDAWYAAHHDTYYTYIFESATNVGMWPNTTYSHWSSTSMVFAVQKALVYYENDLLSLVTTIY